MALYFSAAMRIIRNYLENQDFSSYGVSFCASGCTGASRKLWKVAYYENVFMISKIRSLK